MLQSELTNQDRNGLFSGELSLEKPELGWKEDGAGGPGLSMDLKRKLRLPCKSPHTKAMRSILCLSWASLGSGPEVPCRRSVWEMTRSLRQACNEGQGEGTSWKQ
jgi:hypothetical protein